MLKKYIILFLGLFILSGCADNFRGYFQKSANNKLVDSKGFKGGKRKPLYNNKYITLAKKNIVEDNLDDDQEDDDSDNPSKNETINPTIRNRDMYLNMIKRDMARQKIRSADDEYPLNNANRKVRKNNNDKEEKLQRELDQIKAILRETRQDLSKYSCPNAMQRTYTPPVTNYVPSKDNNNSSRVKQKFIREDDEDNTDKKDSSYAI